MTEIVRFLRDETGQDLIEYTLLMAFIGVGSLLMMTDAGGSTNAIWKDAKNTLSNAAVAAS
jgi:Flp pilus assembly pilin Flp